MLLLKDQVEFKYHASTGSLNSFVKATPNKWWSLLLLRLTLISKAHERTCQYQNNHFILILLKQKWKHPLSPSCRCWMLATTLFWSQFQKVPPLEILELFQVLLFQIQEAIYFRWLIPRKKNSSADFPASGYKNRGWFGSTFLSSRCEFSAYHFIACSCSGWTKALLGVSWDLQASFKRVTSWYPTGSRVEF